ncbi:hypothetical protein [Denitratimonas sp. CY0512]|uniref:hypothetical protein n=1 Tax=Denitratimonas sp. CY0512 TaxID=3131940 RepID=UPI0030A9197B
MQHKLKNVLAGLALAFMALTLGIVLGEPVMPLLPQGMAAVPATQLEAPATALFQFRSPKVQLVASDRSLLIEVREEADDRPVQDKSHSRSGTRGVTLQMPYFSFGSLLPRPPSES